MYGPWIIYFPNLEFPCLFMFVGTPNAHWYNINKISTLSPDDLSFLRNKGNQEHCKNPNNMRCCKGFPFQKMGGFGWDCVPAQGYQNNAAEPWRTDEDGFPAYHQRPFDPADYRNSPSAHSKKRVPNSPVRWVEKAPLLPPAPRFIRDAVHDVINQR